MDTQAAAITYFARGWTPVWIQRGEKKPRSTAWQTTTYANSEAVATAFEEDGNVGVLLGVSSGNLIDIDLDSTAAIRLAPAFLPGTGATFGRPSAPKSHWLYKITGPLGKPIKVVDLWSNHPDDKTKEKPTVVELRSNGQTVFPTSIHPSGEEVAWVEEDDPAEVTWDEIVRKFGRLSAAVLLTRNWSKLSRHEACLPLAGTLLRGGFRDDEAEDFIRTVASMAGDKEVADRIRTVKDTAEKIANGIAVSGIPSLRKAIGVELADAVANMLNLDKSKIEDFVDAPHLTDVGNAERFMVAHGGRFHYSGMTGWLYYDGTRWTRDRDGALVGAAAQQTVKGIWKEAIASPTKARRDELLKWAKQSESVGRVKAIPELVKSQPSISVDQDMLDTQDMWLNCANGTLNLQTGELMPHNPDHLITRLVPFDYDPDAQCPRFLQFLSDSMDGDLEMMDFMLRAMSLGLTALPARNLFIWWGVTNSGKSTLLSIIEGLLGDYAASAQSESLMADRGGVRSDLARLNGCRFVRISEAEDGKKMAEAMVKQITGNDSMTAAFKFKDDFQFKPKFKVTMATNYKPVVKADDEALWERVLLIPWERTVPYDKRIPDLDRQILEQEGSGILAVLFEALQDTLKNGLRAPDKVKAATTGYRDEMDSFGDWINEETEEFEGHAVPLAEAHAQYMTWSHESKLSALSRPAFTRRLTAKGIEHRVVKIEGRPVRCMVGRKLLVTKRYHNL